jgi:hypothetical protein
MPLSESRMIPNPEMPHSESRKLKQPHPESRKREHRDDAKLRIGTSKRREHEENVKQKCLGEDYQGTKEVQAN